MFLELKFCQKTMEKYIKNGSTSLANVRDHTNVENPNTIEIRSFPPPTIVAQPRFVNQRARFVRNYALSVYGLVRVIIIVNIFLFNHLI